MKVTYFPNVIDQKKKALILGSFESFHNGHFKLYQAAKKNKGKVAIMLIDRQLNKPINKPEVVYASLDTRIENMANLGLDYVYVLKFNNEIKLMDGKEFIQRLIKSTAATHLIVGKDFACGRDRHYKAQQIAQDFPTTIVEPYKVNGKKVATSLLKEMVQLGEVDTIKTLSPFPYIVSETVLNRELLFKNNIKPHNGIYATSTIVNDVLYYSYVLIPFKGVAQVFIPDLKIEKGMSLKMEIHFHKLIRVIYSSRDDGIKTEDIKLVKDFLKNVI